ncbi:MAG: DUF4286 family protein [Bacteroidia bacterium]|nr:DUF4286 family protein [Bacteroidia bacterium]MDW8159079.1 DUF4286 family protein [Bacteroidia bacterium]
MIIYSVTININQSIEAEWLEWMLKVHIPEVMQTGCFLNYYINRLIEPESQEGTSTYNIQYECLSLEMINKYQQSFAKQLQAKHTEKFNNQFVAFRTLLERL